MKQKNLNRIYIAKILAMMVILVINFTLINKVQGKPNHGDSTPIIVDSDSNDLKLPIPWDAEALFEPSLDKAKFKDFVQSNTLPLAHLETEKISAFSTGYGLALNKGHIEFPNGYSVGVTVYQAPNITLVTAYKGNKVVANGWITGSGVIENAVKGMDGPRADQLRQTGNPIDYTFQVLATRDVNSFHLNVTDPSNVKIERTSKLVLNVGSYPNPTPVNPNHTGRKVDYQRPWRAHDGYIYLAPQYTVWGTIEVSQPYILKYKEGQRDRESMFKLKVPSPHDLSLPIDGTKAYLTTIENIMPLGSGYVGYITLQNTNEQNRFLTYWDQTGEPTVYYYTNSDGVTQRALAQGSYLMDLNTDVSTGVYSKVIFSDRTEIVKLTPDGQFQVIKTFPKDTDIATRKKQSKDGYIISGIIKNFTGEFTKYKPEDFEEGKAYLFTSEMSEQSELSKLTLFQLTDVDLSVSSLVNVDDTESDPDLDNYLLVGRLNKESSVFVDDYYGYGNIPAKHNGNSSMPDNFILKFSEKWDYAPLISKLEPITISLDEKIAESEFDSKMIADVSVYDTYDIENNVLQTEHLLSRVNKNFNSGYLNPIDWPTLGFDRNKIGPQLTTYFITDSLHHVTATSRWVNTVNKQVASDSENNLFLKAENFSINTDDSKKLNQDDVKKRAKTKAWSGKLSKDQATMADPFAENATLKIPQLSAKVTINEVQLNVIQNATEVKPYPLDLTYRENDVTVVRRIWIFVTNEQTVVDETNNIVMYAKNFSLLLKEAKNETMASILSQADTKVYDYQDTSKAENLPPIANKDNLANLTVSEEDLNRIQSVKVVGDLEGVRLIYFKNEKKIEASIKINIYQGDADVTIRFIDGNNLSVYPDVKLANKQIGEILILNNQAEITTALDEINHSGDYTLTASPDTEYLVQESNNVINYVFKGHLMLQEVPDKLSLELGRISPFEQNLKYASNTDDFIVTVRDTRAYAANSEPDSESERGNFKVSVALTKPFRHKVSQKLLEGALLEFGNSEIGAYDENVDEGDLSGYSTVVIKSEPNVDERDQTDYSFKLDSRDKKSKQELGWNLTVPPLGVQKGSYEAELTWLLEKTP